MAKPPSSNIRLTITVTPEVHAAFARMAEASSLPIGRCMGEWLADTLEGVEFVTAQLVKARAAPRQVVREMRQGMLGLVDELDQLQTDLRSGKRLPPGGGDARSAPRPAAAAGLATAESATGGLYNADLPAGGGLYNAKLPEHVEAPRPVIRGGKSPGKTLPKTLTNVRGLGHSGTPGKQRGR